MKRYLYITFALLVLLAGQAGAQRRLPKMKGVSLTAGMTDGFYCKANKPAGGFHLCKKEKPVGAGRRGTEAQYALS